MKRIYFDHAATTPLSEAAKAAMLATLDGPHNPSSLHAEGRAARAQLDRSRAFFAASLNRRPGEIIFTASGSESISLALVGHDRAVEKPGIFLTSAIEHRAVLAAGEALAALGWQTAVMPVDADGHFSLEDLERALAANRFGPSVLSFMLVNNEIGTINDIGEILRIARQYKAFVHCDAVACGETIDPSIFDVDALSLAAHKFGGPVGCGILAVKGLTVAPLIFGGGQERGRRAGTEDIIAIAGAAAAWQQTILERETVSDRLWDLRERFELGILDALPGTMLTAGGAVVSPSISHIQFPDIDAAGMLAALDLAGIAASAGSACSSGAAARSHVARALGISDADAVVRFSFGRDTTLEEIDEAIVRILTIVTRIRGGDALRR